MQITTIKNNIISTEIPGLTVPDVLMQDFLIPKLLSYGEKLCLIDGVTGRAFSYKELVHRSQVLACSFQRRGIKQGDYVCIHTRSSLEFWICYLAVIQIGAVTVLAKPSLNLRELLHIITDSKPSFLIVEEEFVEKVKEARQGLEFVKDVFVIGKSREFTPIDELLKGDDVSFKPVQPTDPSTTPLVLPYSSGTTGIPKAVVHTHKSIIALAIQLGPESTQIYGPEEVILQSFPATHASGSCLGIGILYAGATAVQVTRFEDKLTLQLIEKYKVTLLPVFPSKAKPFLDNPLLDKYDVSSVQVYLTGGSHTPDLVFEKAKKRFNLKRILHIYGASEIIISTCPEKGSLNYKHVGKPVGFTDMKVADINTGEALPPYKTGEICARSPLLFYGYFGKPEATAAVIDKDGFFHTGDEGYYDDDGNFYITDRIKELIKCLDQQVSPSELEVLLAGYPGVNAAAVAGVPHEKFGEAPTAFVIRADGHDNLTAQEIIDYIAGQCSYHKHLHGGVHFVTTLPLTETGKYMRRFLRDTVLKAKHDGVEKS